MRPLRPVPVAKPRRGLVLIAELKGCFRHGSGWYQIDVKFAAEAGKFFQREWRLNRKSFVWIDLHGNSTFIAARISRFEVTSVVPRAVAQVPRARRRFFLRAELQSDSIVVSRRAAQLIHSDSRKRERQAGVAVDGRGVSRWPAQREYTMRGIKRPAVGAAATGR